MTRQPLALAAYLPSFFTQRKLAPKTRQMYRWAVSRLDASHGTPITVEELNTALLKRLLDKQTGRYTPKTIGKLKTCILTLWVATHNANLCPQAPSGISQTKPESLTLWTAGELEKLLAACERQPGYFTANGIKIAPYWRSYVLTMRDTALLPRELRRMERNWITPDGTLSLTNPTTGQERRFDLRPETVAAIDESFPPHRELIWPLWTSRQNFIDKFNRIVLNANITRGGLRKLHRTIIASTVKHERRVA